MLDIDGLFWICFNYLNMFIYFLAFKIILDYSNNLEKKDLKSYIPLLFMALISFLFYDERILLGIISCTIFCKLHYKDKLLKATLVSCIYWIFVYNAIEKISTTLIFGVNYFKIGDVDAFIVLLESLVFDIVLLSLIILVYIYTKKLYKSRKMLDIYFFIPIITSTCSLLLIFRDIAKDTNLLSTSMLKWLIMPILLLISNIYFFIMIKKIIHSYTIKQENKILKENVLKEYNYYLNINKEQDKVKEIYHDIKNHMVCIRDLCEYNNTKKVIEYIDSIELNFKKYDNFKQDFTSGSMIVDSILKNKVLVCEEKSIDFDINVDFSKNEFMDMIDICIIFSNIIDNAIEACEKIEIPNLDKKIRLYSKYIDEFCIIVIENTKTNEIIKNNTSFLTSKKDSSIHGIGLNNVRKSVEKYSGELVTSYSNNKFTLKIMIPCNSEV
ncbi:GHKL domain-containing protein [Paraclostridium sordellii]|uniref:sensor histidine kinase n=1 Tax=Paraclostridium sordellii TaxID=1505 RepID=UPI0005E64BB4|nr:sensor histidine kinase [Paeniclostridium sordellii]CEP81050.1 two-component signal transduction sensor histidine kinase [[Clostridium] sordellii] [Paeniclostridium sordellii]